MLKSIMQLLTLLTYCRTLLINQFQQKLAPSTRQLIQERNKLRTLWQRTHNIALRPCINALKHKIETATNNQLSNTWQNILQGLGTDNIQDTWRITRNLTNDTNNIPPLKLNNRTATTNQEKVNLFADTLQDIFTTNPDGDPNFSKVTEITVRSFLSQIPLPAVRKTYRKK
jgi:hypothetical protein